VTKRARARRIRNIERAEALCSRSAGSEKTRSLLDLSLSRACARSARSSVLSPLRRALAAISDAACLHVVHLLVVLGFARSSADRIVPIPSSFPSLSERTERARRLGERSAEAREEKRSGREDPRFPCFALHPEGHSSRPTCALAFAFVFARLKLAKQRTLDNPGALLGSLPLLARD